MSQQGGDDQSQGNFLWEAQPWSMSNSDNSGGGSEQKSDKQLLESRSNSPDGLTGEKRAHEVVTGIKGSSSKGGGVGGGESDHEIHIWTERERRKKMRNMFSNLHALLPQLPPKADKSTIVDEAVNYIKSLQQTLQKLQNQKLERMQSMSTTFSDPSSSIALQPQGLMDTRESFLAEQGKNWSTALTPNGTLMNSPSSISIPRLSNSFQTWCSPNVVLSVTGEDAQISICTTKKPGILSIIFYVMEKHKLEVISAHVSSDYFRSMYMIHAHASGVSDQFPEALMIEEIFKLAVGEMLLWLPS